MGLRGPAGALSALADWLSATSVDLFVGRVGQERFDGAQAQHRLRRVVPLIGHPGSAIL